MADIQSKTLERLKLSLDQMPNDSELVEVKPKTKEESEIIYHGFELDLGGGPDQKEEKEEKEEKERNEREEKERDGEEDKAGKKKDERKKDPERKSKRK
jgi:hypothetical protein